MRGGIITRIDAIVTIVTIDTIEILEEIVIIVWIGKIGILTPCLRELFMKRCFSFSSRFSCSVFIECEKVENFENGLGMKENLGSD